MRITTTPSHHLFLKKDEILELEKIFYGIELIHFWTITFSYRVLDRNKAATFLYLPIDWLS